MNIDKFMEIVQGSEVKRWHTRTTIKTQNNAEHQWRVAIIAELIEPTISKATLLHALTHDCFEHLTGDIPYPVKQNNPALGFQIKGAENHFAELLDLPKPSPEEVNVVKVADRLCAFLFALQESTMGNVAMSEVSGRILMAFKKEEIPITNDQGIRLSQLIIHITEHFTEVMK